MIKWQMPQISVFPRARKLCNEQRIPNVEELVLSFVAYDKTKIYHTNVWFLFLFFHKWRIPEMEELFQLSDETKIYMWLVVIKWH